MEVIMITVRVKYFYTKPAGALHRGGISKTFDWCNIVSAPVELTLAKVLAVSLGYTSIEFCLKKTKRMLGKNCFLCCFRKKEKKRKKKILP